MGDMAQRVQRLVPDAIEKFLAGKKYPSDLFDRALKAHRHPLGISGLDAEEKAVRAHLKVYQGQEKRQQTERVQAPTRGYGWGRGGPSRSRARDYDSGPDFFCNLWSKLSFPDAVGPKTINVLLLQYFFKFPNLQIYY